ncbi:ABC transporter permease [Planctobacterium marinum]|uniref:ABC transporter permease n=1 Tax=Planctobacterium marinum TaxID=1631968 RepID=UPI001E598A11|nr:ABC transporter permease [Planctobacterium marinum]MCC2607123.1 ABC transporter permease [Planctobacterium marinum]
MILSIASGSLKSRKSSVILTIISLVVSISLLLSVEHIRSEAKDSFGRTVSGVDLIVGARTGQLNLLLYSVFRVGNATNNIDWATFEKIQADELVKWAIPVSLGDSHKGYRVMGTSSDYFKHFRYGQKQLLDFQQGEAFGDILQTVIGAEVAQKLGYQVGDSITLSHGVGGVSFSNHDEAPFVVTGILKATGTPVDQTVHVSLESLELVHLPAAHIARYVSDPQAALNQNPLQPKTITAFFLGLNSKFATFGVQRSINNYRGEPLLAILPGVALAELWQMLGTVENLLRVISVLILISSLFGLATMLLASMRERHREIAVLRAIGAGPGLLFVLIQAEALLVSAVATLLSFLLVWLTLVVSNEWLSTYYGLFISTDLLTQDAMLIALMVVIATSIVACIPAIGAYRRALHSGLNQ